MTATIITLSHMFIATSFAVSRCIRDSQPQDEETHHSGITYSIRYLFWNYFSYLTTFYI